MHFKYNTFNTSGGLYVLNSVLISVSDGNVRVCVLCAPLLKR
jgi:hypothetical protein